MLCVAHTDGGVSFTVSGSWQPPAERTATQVLEAAGVEDAEPVSIGAVVAGARDGRALRAVWSAAFAVAREGVDVAAKTYDVDYALAAVEFWREVRNVMLEHGFLREDGE